MSWEAVDERHGKTKMRREREARVQVGVSSWGLEWVGV